MTLQDEPTVIYPTGRGWMVVSDPDVDGVVIVRDESGRYMRVNKDNILPIQTQADKERDEQIEQFKLKVFRGNGFALGESKETAIATKAIDNGVQVLKPGQKICTPLTDEQKDDLIMEMWNEGVFESWKVITKTIDFG